MNIINNLQLNNLKLIRNIWPCGQQVLYSQYGPEYIESISHEKQLKELIESGEAERLRHIPIKAARTNQNNSIHYDPVVQKFTNYLMRKGNKVLARSLIEKAFENIKRIQLEKYNKEMDPEKKSQIETDPLKILHLAVENCKPVVHTIPIKKGGATYQIPTPITDNRARFLSMNWLIEAGRDKERSARWVVRVAHEMVDASQNQGRAVKRKQDLHKQCEANRAYAHYRWS